MCIPWLPVFCYHLNTKWDIFPSKGFRIQNPQNFFVFKDKASLPKWSHIWDMSSPFLKFCQKCHQWNLTLVLSFGELVPQPCGVTIKIRNWFSCFGDWIHFFNTINNEIKQKARTFAETLIQTHTNHLISEM